MAKTIVIEMGDCFINLSRQEGFYWETVWNHSQNTELRQRRKHLNILKPGDAVFIPDRTTKELARPTEQLHQFVVKGHRARFTITLLDMGEPRANEPYILIVNGNSKEGVTDDAGTLTESIPPDARDGILLVGESQEEMALHFGYVDPIGEMSGVQSRLRNLGFYEHEIKDELIDETSAAVAEFQRTNRLLGNGELNDETLQALVAAHGS